MLIPFGILSAAAGGAAFESDYELISTAFGTGSSGVIDFTSIPATYKHLQIRYTAKNTSTTSNFMTLRMNGITTGSYASHRLLGNGSTVTSLNQTSATSITLVEAMVLSTGTSVASGGVIDILDYTSSSKNTTIRTLYGQASSIPRMYLVSGALFNTAVINSLTFTAASNNFDSISRFSLYGIRG
jgi:hypothetical protein